ALTTLWHERQRYLPGILAVSFSALLIALQCGLLLGLFSITSIPIDHGRAHLWSGSTGVLSVDLGQSVPTAYVNRLASQPEGGPPEMFLQGFAPWKKPTGGSDLCMVIGSRLDDDSLGAINELTPELRARLTEPGSIVIDESELGRLGLKGVGDTAEIRNSRVRVVGLIKGVKSMAGPYVFCSLRTARPLLRLNDDQSIFFLARCHDPKDAPIVAKRLKSYDDMSTFTSDDFSFHSRLHWLT